SGGPCGGSPRTRSGGGRRAAPFPQGPWSSLTSEKPGHPTVRLLVSGRQSRLIGPAGPAGIRTSIARERLRGLLRRSAGEDRNRRGGAHRRDGGEVVRAGGTPGRREQFPRARVIGPARRLDGLERESRDFRGRGQVRRCG